MRPLLYILHSGNLYGTERMALTTMSGLAGEYAPVLFAPPGPVHEEAARQGIAAHVFRSPLELTRRLLPHFRAHEQLALIATGVTQSLLAHGLAASMRRRLRHLHIVHGGTDERLSYGRKAHLGRLPIEFVAVSGFVRNRLVEHRCAPDRIRVIENFLPQQSHRLRPAFSHPGAPPGVRRIAVVSRVDPIKRLGLILRALSARPELQALEIEIFGEGSEFESFREQAQDFPNVRLRGFVPDAAERLPDFDLLLHTCAEEPFGLAILEAMSAGVPVLVPNTGGAGSLVEHGVSGFHFPANDGISLGAALAELARMPVEKLDAVVAGAWAAMAGRFSPARGLAEYRSLLQEDHHAA